MAADGAETVLEGALRLPWRPRCAPCQPALLRPAFLPAQCIHPRTAGLLPTEPEALVAEACVAMETEVKLGVEAAVADLLHQVDAKAAHKAQLSSQHQHQPLSSYPATQLLEPPPPSYPATQMAQPPLPQTALQPSADNASGREADARVRTEEAQQPAAQAVPQGAAAAAPQPDAPTSPDRGGAGAAPAGEEPAAAAPTSQERPAEEEALSALPHEHAAAAAATDAGRASTQEKREQQLLAETVPVDQTAAQQQQTEGETAANHAAPVPLIPETIAVAAEEPACAGSGDAGVARPPVSSTADIAAEALPAPLVAATAPRDVTDGGGAGGFAAAEHDGSAPVPAAGTPAVGSGPSTSHATCASLVGSQEELRKEMTAVGSGGHGGGGSLRHHSLCARHIRTLETVFCSWLRPLCAARCTL